MTFLRTPLLLLALLSAASATGVASAHRDHPGCGTSDWDTNDQPLFWSPSQVDVWLGDGCVGVTYTNQDVLCGGLDAHPVVLHAPVLYNGGCETGLLVDCDNEFWIVYACA